MSLHELVSRSLKVLDRSDANFYEKALFVKVDLATALWWKQLLFALRAMLLFALSGSSLGSSVHYEIRLFELEALQSSERPSWKGRPSSLAQSPLEIRSAISGKGSLGHPPLQGRLAASSVRVSSPPLRSMASLLSCLLPLLAPMRVVERIVDLSGYPQAVQEHTELSRHGHRRSFLCVLTSLRGYLLSVASQVRVSSEGTLDVVSATYQKLPQHLISFLGDTFLTRISISRLLGGGHKPQVCSYRAAFFEAVGVLQGQHERQRRELSNSLDLAQELGFLWVALLGDRLQLALVVPDALC